MGGKHKKKNTRPGKNQRQKKQSRGNPEERLEAIKQYYRLHASWPTDWRGYPYGGLDECIKIILSDGMYYWNGVAPGQRGTGPGFVPCKDRSVALHPARSATTTCLQCWADELDKAPDNELPKNPMTGKPLLAPEPPIFVR